MASPRRTARPAHHSTTARWVLAPLRVVLALALALAALPFLVTSASATVSTIAIDGDQDGTSTDWQGLQGTADVSVITDGVGTNDRTGIKGAESDYPGWEAIDPSATNGSPSGKSDVGTIRVASFRQDPSGDLFGAVGFDRGSGSGTGRYYFELNQASYTGVNPPRTVDDVRVVVGINGNDPETCQGAQRWTTSGWGPLQSCAGIVSFAVNPQDITDYYGSPFATGGVLPTNQFMELSINLTRLGATTCPVAGFKTFEMRTQEGGENGDTSRLKDVATGQIHIPSDCGSLVVAKTVDGHGGAVGAGATFEVSPNPATGTGSVVVTTGPDGTVTVPDARPGSYQVTELAPPGGALLPAGSAATRTVAVPKGAPGTVSFDDGYGTGAFTKSYQGTDPGGLGATFTLTRTEKWSYDVTPDDGTGAPSLQDVAGRSLDVTDNGDADRDDAIGRISVSGLEGGRWCIVEKSAPTGWEPTPGQGQKCFTVGPTDSSSDAHPSLDPTGDPATFDNRLSTVTLRVDKTESSAGVTDSAHALSGVTFNLYADADGAPGALVDTEVTGSAGHASFAALDWQKAYWLEEVALDGYRVGLSPNPRRITFSASDGGTTVPVAVDNPRTEWSIRLGKVDGQTQRRLSGGDFELWRESNDRAGLQRDGSDPDSHLAADATLSDGSLTFSRTDHDIPWGYTYYVFEATPPTGYGLMTPNPVVVDAGQKPSGADPTLVLHVTDPQLRSTLTVVKHDAVTHEVVDGATFQLWKDTNGVEGLQMTAGGGHDADTVAGSCGPTTGGEPCSVDDLGFGAYWWYEAQAPTGYGYPADRVSSPITVGADDAGGSFPTTVFEDPQIPSALSVLKQDADAPGTVVDGAAFELWRESNGVAGLQRDGAGDVPADTVAGECTTADGQACGVGDLGFGTYYWYESQAPAGYGYPTHRVGDPVEVEASNAGTTFPVTVFEDPQRTTSLQVLKHDADTGAVVAGASFQLWKESGDQDGLQRGTGGDAPVGSCTTTGSGPCSVDGLKFGTYYWFETAAPQGYELPDSEAARTSVAVTVDASNAGTALVPTVIADPETRTSLSVLKRDADDGSVVPGATFELWRESNGLAGLQRNAAVVGGETVLADSPQGTCTTTGSDPCSLGGLLFGTYYWYELSAPPGYGYPADPDRTSAPVVVDAENAGTTLASTVISDPQTRSELAVLKVDADQPQLVVAGATFELWRESDGVAGLQTAGTADTLVGECTTVASDPCSPSSSLVFGSYYWLETAAPTGYRLPTLQDRLTWAGANAVLLSAVNAGTEITVARVPDPQVRSELSVVKRDADTGEVVDGATFRLWRESNGVTGLQRDGQDADALVDTCATDGGAPCSVDGLLFGTYYWFESQAPAGYGYPDSRASDAVVVDAGHAGNDVAVTVFRDPQVRSELSVVKRDADTGDVVDGATFQLWRESNGDTGLQRDGQDADELVDTCVTDGGDPCSVDGLLFGTYYWYELSAPPGYGYPDSRVSDAVEVHAENAGDDHGATVIADPEKRTDLSVLKLDEETQEPLAGATFQAYWDADGNGELGAGDVAVGDPQVTGDDGEATWTGLLFGHFLVEETRAPDGYDLPDRTVQAVEIDADNAGGVVRVTFLDGPQGVLEIVKSAFERDGDAWAASDGAVAFEDTVRYVVTVTASGPRIHHDVVVSDFVPGYDPDDADSTGQAAYVAGSASCREPGTCDVAVDGSAQKVTWHLGDLRDESRTVEFDVTIPEASDPVPVDGVFSQVFANVAAVAWTDTGSGPQVLGSNQVLDSVTAEVAPDEAVGPGPGAGPGPRPRPAPAAAVAGVESTLADTGGPDQMLVWSGVVLLLTGCGIVLGSRRRGRRGA